MESDLRMQEKTRKIEEVKRREESLLARQREIFTEKERQAEE
jgi:hypothetical protein